jgi:ABC-2 type transport system ATP-binding protein
MTPTAIPAKRCSAPGDADTAICARNLWKHYGHVLAVRGIDLTIASGEIFGLIGPDGAGKTTTFQILAGVLEATSGSAEVFGVPAREARSQTGYLTQTFTLYPDLTVWENIRYNSDLRRVPRKDVEARGQHYLEMFDLARFGGRLAGQLSGGMRQKLALAAALVPEPRILLLDEPTTGVDPVSRREFWDALTHLSASGLTILIATPYLDEAERCHRVALMYEGQLQQVGTPADLRRGLDAARLELRMEPLGRAGSIIERLIPDRSAGEHGEILDVQRFGDRLDVLVHDRDRGIAILQSELAENHIRIDEIQQDEPTLENVFVTRLRSLGLELHRLPFPARGSPHVRGKAAIEATNLVRRFGDFTAVNDVNLQIRYGEIYGLLGANGAGKTTTIKMLCGLLPPSEGEVRLAGETDVQSAAIREQIGYMSQKFSLYEDLSVKENLEFFAGVYGVPAREREEKRNWVLSFSGLQGRENQVTGSLPGGWKQRVAFGAAIMHEPGILFLDEPTSGVDPLARRAFWDMINRLADAGAAILVTTHYLEESEQCNRLGLMVAGELVAEGTPTRLKNSQRGHVLEFSVDQPQRASGLLKNLVEPWRVSLFGSRLRVITEETAPAGLRSIRQMLESHGLRVLDAREGRFSMEDVFIGVVEQARLLGKVTAEE